jgi:hypothetical protein
MRRLHRLQAGESYVSLTSQYQSDGENSLSSVYTQCVRIGSRNGREIRQFLQQLLTDVTPVRELTLYYIDVNKRFLQKFMLVAQCILQITGDQLSNLCSCAMHHQNSFAERLKQSVP